jgi:hypothetical protein
MQNEITTLTPLLDEEGKLTNPGFAKSMLYDYDRSKITAKKIRIKEWDFYQISNRETLLQLTIGHVTYGGAINATLLDLTNGNRYDATYPLIFPKDKLKMPKNPEVDHKLEFNKKDFYMCFDVKEGKRHLICKTKKCDIDVTLNQPHKDAMVIATPFKEFNNYFYLNEKINCMGAEGYAQFGDKKVTFTPDKSFGLLDWGRGVWPYRHSWFWGNGSTIIDGHSFGFNIGWGFGDTSKATENMLFYDGKAHNIDVITMTGDLKDLTSKCILTSSDKRFEMTFQPIFDNHTKTNLVVAHNECHQVFGDFNGKIVLDDGKTLIIKNMWAFIENSVNNW